MDIFLLRHFESVKNTQVTFSSIDDKEELTENGVIQGKSISNNLRQILELKGLTAKNIYCAKSVRAQRSADLIASTLSGNVQVQAFNELLSTKSKDILGKTKKQVMKNNPEFIRQLSLYDAGIFSSYDFHREVGRDLKIEYEKKVCECIEKIVKNDVKENVKIICLHNSSITAAVINIARKLCKYPKDYYGKVIADNGKFFWIHEENNEKKFIVANCESEILLEMIRGEMYVT